MFEENEIEITCISGFVLWLNQTLLGTLNTIYNKVSDTVALSFGSQGEGGLHNGSW